MVLVIPQFRGIPAMDVIKAQDKHLKEMVAGGDETHKSALKDMQGRWKNPIKGMRLFRRKICQTKFEVFV